MMKKQIKIGPEFFAKAKNDYNDWHWAIIREFMQNSIDCGSDTIGISINLDNDGETSLVVENNGEPMTRDIMENKLLSLGSSGKEFKDSVGGFGKAKEILYFCHSAYTIKSGNIVVKGSGAEYTIEQSDDKVDGTASAILIQVGITAPCRVGRRSTSHRRRCRR